MKNSLKEILQKVIKESNSDVKVEEPDEATKKKFLEISIEMRELAKKIRREEIRFDRLSYELAKKNTCRLATKLLHTATILSV